MPEVRTKTAMNTTSSIGTPPTTNPSPPASRPQWAGLARRPHGPKDAASLAYLPATTPSFLVCGATAQLHSRVSPRAMIGGGLALVAVGLVVMTTAGAGLELARDPARQNGIAVGIAG